MGKPKITFKECDDRNYDGRQGCAVSKIVIHYTGDKGATGKDELHYFANNYTQTSAHFFVDETGIYQSVKCRYRAWHCGLGGGTFETSHHPKYGIVTNSNSIGIECCIDKNGRMKYGTFKNVCKLVQWLKAQYDIPEKNVVRHYDVTGKPCPNCHTLTHTGKVSKKSLLNEKYWKKWRHWICTKKF
jgi:N-acetylmuramoyl-L-alanine amidase